MIMIDLNGKILKHQHLHFSTLEISRWCSKEENNTIIKKTL